MIRYVFYDYWIFQCVDMALTLYGIEWHCWFNVYGGILEAMGENRLPTIAAAPDIAVGLIDGNKDETINWSEAGEVSEAQVKGDKA